MAVCVDKADAEKAVGILEENGETAFIIGETVSGDDGVVFE